MDTRSALKWLAMIGIIVIAAAETHRGANGFAERRDDGLKVQGTNVLHLLNFDV